MFKAEFILPRKKRFNQALDFNTSYIFTILMAFFIGRANIMDKLTPFGIAFISAYIITGKFNLYLFISTILGMFTFHGFVGGLEYFLAANLIFIIYNRYIRLNEISLMKASIITGMIFTLTKLTILLIFKDLFIYDIFIILFEGLIVFTLSYMFSYGISTGRTNRSFTNEKIVCNFILLALVIAGIGNFSIFNISIKNIVNILLILYFGYSEGALMGSAIGLALGLATSISQTEMPFILAIYGLSGLFAGVFRELGKIGSALGFLVANSIVSFYINGYITSFILQRELILSIVLFYIVYRPLNNYISDYVDMIMGRTKERNHGDKKDQIAINRLKEISELFDDLGRTYRKSTENEGTVSNREVYELIDQIANAQCANCGMQRFCWEEGFYTTYYAIFNMVSIVEQDGVLIDENIPVAIRDYCINKEEIIEEIKRYFNTFKLNNMWKNKILENRILVSDQLEEVAKIVDDIANDIYIKPIFNEDTEEIIFANLRNNKVDVRDVIVMELDEDNFEIYIDVEKAYKDINRGENIKRLVSQSINVPLKLCLTHGKPQGESQKYKLIKSNRYNALTTVISEPSSPSEVSGDNYTFGEGENSYFVALSDGMGTGEKADRESTIAINLLESFLEAKFDHSVALKTINSILMLKSNDELFATLDVSLLDLYTGKLQIIKTGSPATFIKRGDEVKIINSQSLPVGILKDVEFNMYEEYLEDGDILIMMSDGVLDANKNAINNEKWMKEVIMDIDSLNPSTIANEIFNIADLNSQGESKDDMTILVTKIWKTV